MKPVPRFSNPMRRRNFPEISNKAVGNRRENQRVKEALLANPSEFILADEEIVNELKIAQEQHVLLREKIAEQERVVVNLGSELRCEAEIVTTLQKVNSKNALRIKKQTLLLRSGDEQMTGILEKKVRQLGEKINLENQRLRKKRSYSTPARQSSYEYSTQNSHSFTTREERQRRILEREIAELKKRLAKLEGA